MLNHSFLALKKILNIAIAATLIVTLLPFLGLANPSPVKASTPAPLSVDKAFKATGTQYLKTANDTRVIPASGDFTVQLWLRPDSNIQNYARPISQGTNSTNHFRMERNNDGQIYWRYGAYSSTFGLIPKGMWTHVAFSFSTTEGIKGYVNGNRVYSCSGCKTSYNVGSNFMLGTDASAPTNTIHLWKGSLDEVRVFKTQRSEAEIKNDMHTYANVNDPNLTGYYDFNDTSLLNKAAGTGKASNSDLDPILISGSVGWEDIAVEATESNNKFIKFSRTIITSDGGWQIPQGVKRINALVVGGGGGGGSRHAGGGGAGAVKQQLGIDVVTNETLNVKVGAGGIPGVSGGSGKNGESSEIYSTSISSIIANGGGGGNSGTGLAGASGGGGGPNSAGGLGTVGEGFNGGRGIFGRYSNGGENWLGGGGGGAGTAGLNAVWNFDFSRNGQGGDGVVVSWISPAVRTALGGPGQVVSSQIYFGGGGAGGGGNWFQVQRAGYGGGGSLNGGFATANSGGGGGGGAINYWFGGVGGTGVVILSYTDTPNAPTGLTARAVTESQINLSWTAPADNNAILSDYVVERSTDNLNWEILDDGINLNTSYAATGLTPETLYYFRVAAKNDVKTSAYSTTVNARTWLKVPGSSPECDQYVSKIAGVSATLSGDSCIVAFTDTTAITDWSLPVGTAKIDALVVGGGGGGGANAGSGGGGGAVTEAEVILGTSNAPSLSISVGAGGLGQKVSTSSAAISGVKSSLSAPAGTDTFLIESAGGVAGSASTSTTAAASPTPAPIPTPSVTGSLITITAPKVFAGGSGGIGQKWETFTVGTSDLGAPGSGGYQSTLFTSPIVSKYGGGGGGGPVSFSQQITDSPIPVLNHAEKSIVEIGVEKKEYVRIVLYFDRTLKANSTFGAYNLNIFVEENGSRIVYPNGQVTSTNRITLIYDTDDNLLSTSGTHKVTYSDSLGTKILDTLDNSAQSFSNIKVYEEAESKPAVVMPAKVLSEAPEASQAGIGSNSGGNSAFASTAGSYTTAVAGVPNSGGGGGAGTYSGTNTSEADGADGGSGIVIIKYPVVNPPTLSTSPLDLTLKAGETASFSATFATTVSKIKWQQSTTGGTTWTDIASTETTNANSSTYTFSATEAMNGTRFRALGTNMNGSAEAFTPSNSANLTVTKNAPVLPVGAMCDGSSTQNGLTTTAGHGKVFYIDTGQGQNIDAGYVAYGVKSDVARGDLWVQLSNFSGGVLSLADPSTSAMPLSSVTAGGSGTAFFMLKATGATTVAQSHILRIYDQKPTIGDPPPIYECSFAFIRVEETIKAAANKLESVTTVAASSIGSTMTITVNGDSGTIGQGNSIDGRMFWLIPAARSTWPVSAVRLEKTELTMYSNSARTAQLGETFVNTLRINNSNGLNPATRQYWTAVYTFRVVGPAASTAPIIPIAMISSGTQIKHTDVSGINGGVLNLADPPPPITLTVNKNVSPLADVRSDGTTRFEYEIIMKNTGSNNLIIDEVIDTPDEKAAYVTGTAKYGFKTTSAEEAPAPDDFIAIKDPGKIGTTNSIAFSGPLTIPANSTRKITYSMAIETCKVGQSYSLQNTAIARSGEITIGSGAATQSVVTINGNCGETEVIVFEENVTLPPEVVTGTADLVTTSSAKITGSVDPNGVAGRKLRFAYSTNSTLAGSPQISNLIDTTTNSTVSYGVSANLSGLTASTTYYYRIEIEVDGVWQQGEILSFTTDSAAGTSPTVSTSPVTQIDSTTAIFNGTIDPNQVINGAKVLFEYAESADCASTGTLSNTGNLQEESIAGEPSTFVDAVFNGANSTQVSFGASGLSANTDYCVRIVGVYSGATRVVGDWVQFKTKATPEATPIINPQTITFNTGISAIPAGGTITVQAYADSKLAVTYTSVDPSICTVHPTTGVVTAVATSGNCAITATQAGNDSYYAAEPQTLNFLISPPVVTTTSLPTGNYASSYSQQLNASGGNGSYSNWSLAAGSEMPAGLSINSTTGVISGTPTLAGIYVIYVTTVSNGIISASQSLTITINKVAITVRGSSHTLTFGDAAPQITPVYDESEFISPDTSSVLLASFNVAPTCETNYTRGDQAGDNSKFSSCKNAWATNYSFNYLAGSITIEPFKVTITALDAAKSNEVSGADTIVSADPTLKYKISPSLPSGQTIEDVLNTTPSFTREGGGTSPGSQPTADLVGKEAPGQYEITPALTRKPAWVACIDTTTEEEEISVTEDETEVGAPGTPGQVRRLSATAGNEKITLRWIAPKKTANAITDYVIEQSLNGLSSWTVINDGVSTDTKYTITGLTNNTTYYYRVKAVNLNGTGSASVNASAKPTAPSAGTDNQTCSQVPVTRYNYEVTYEVGKLTISEKIIPVLTTQNAEVTYSNNLTGHLNASATHNSVSVPGTYTYTYINSAGNTVTLNNATILPAGNYSVTVTFTPTNGSLYFGPIYGIINLVVKPLEITVTPINSAKQNLIEGNTRRVSSDPQFDYVLSRPLPAGRTLSDVFPNGVTVTRKDAGVAAGGYAVSNSTIEAKEKPFTYDMLASGESSANYKITFATGTFTITEKIVPTLESNDSMKMIGESVGNRLNAKGQHNEDSVAGSFEYSYVDNDGVDQIVTSSSKLPLGFYTFKIKFTPSDTARFFGPIYAVMGLTVNPFFASITPGNPSPAPTPSASPASITPGNPSPAPTPSASPATNDPGNSSGRRNPPRFVPQNTNPRPQTPFPLPTNNSNPQAQSPTITPGQTNPLPEVVIPSLPGLNRLLETRPQSGSQIQGILGTPSQRTVDFGSGIKTVEEIIQEGGTPTDEQGKRTLNQLKSETLGGFSPPGAGTRIEIIGARTGARFIVSNQSQIDTFTLIEAMRRSIPTQAQDFAQIMEIRETNSPRLPDQWTQDQRNYAAEIFAASGLSTPVNLRDLYSDQFNSWIKIDTIATTYLPGSIVYLTVTSDPLVIGSAVVDQFGNVEVSGDMPVEWLQSGEHRIRLVGIRALDGVTIDEQGEVQLSEELISEIEKFDLGTQATITVIGSNALGGEHAALRVVPLIPSAPWWTMWIILGIGLMTLYLRRKNYLFNKQRRYAGLIAVGLAGLPAVLFGWFSTVTLVVWVGIAATLLSLAINWFVPVEEEEQVRNT